LADIADSGAITAQIADKIVKSRFGICYFSEPGQQPSQHKYVDNPNVIFEAGMLHALINSPDAPPSGWIPVREDDSPPPPSTSRPSGSRRSLATRAASWTR
jgi:hypothetical protein